MPKIKQVFMICGLTLLIIILSGCLLEKGGVTILNSKMEIKEGGIYNWVYVNGTAKSNYDEDVVLLITAYFYDKDGVLLTNTMPQYQAVPAGAKFNFNLWCNPSLETIQKIDHYTISFKRT